jgi:4-diphosphocytidyl-2-C-methyl-D-erythritol kinase
MKERIETLAYAKINLSIDVLAKRSDGYHDVSMVMHQIELADRLTVDVSDAIGTGTIRVESDLPGLPTGTDNLAGRAVELFHTRYGKGNKFDTIVRIEKRIPMAAGLAGGSADAAAVILALNEILDTKLSMPEMMDLGLALGADVPFCLMGQSTATCARARGVGEILTPLPSLDAYVVLSKPPIEVSTADIFSNFDFGGIHCRPDTEALVRGLGIQDFQLITASMFNVLEDTATAMYPIIRETRRAMELIAGLYGKENWAVLMSGSGPTVFAITQEKEVAEEIERAMKSIHRETFLTKTLMAPRVPYSERNETVLK